MCQGLQGLLGQPVPGQSILNQTVVKGIVWDPPAQRSKALSDLIEMKRVGIEAVRTPLISDPALFRLGDSLQIQFYQDLPLDYLTTSELADTLDYARDLLAQSIQLASGFHSARHFGLARHTDTSVALACRYFDELTRAGAAASSAPIHFYYQTAFIEEDQCSTFVDFVLIEARTVGNVSSLYDRWRQAHPDVAMGFGALGMWIKDLRYDQSNPDGYLRKYSLAYQARYLEEKLSTLLSSPAFNDLYAIFVYRWRDFRMDHPSAAHDLEAPFSHTYGLLSDRDVPRSALQVVRGFYLGKQFVFAFSAGKESASQRYWMVLLIWVNLFILGLAYAYFPRFRLTLRRYFLAHNFYRNAVGEGREQLLGPNALFFLCISTAFAVCMMVILDQLRITEVFNLMLRWAPTSVQYTIVALLAQPHFLFVVIGGSYALTLSIWTSAMAVLSSRSRTPLLPGQSFTLVVWAQWPMLLAMVIAGVLGTESTTLNSTTLVLFCLAVLVIGVGGFVATLRDYLAICRANILHTVLAVSTNPLLLILLAAVYSCFKHQDNFLFIFRLIRAT